MSQRHGAVSPHDSLGIAAPGGHLYATMLARKPDSEVSC
jgi:hypothetical protein